MSNNGTLLLSKVLDNNDVQALARHNITADHFKVEVDRQAYEFIRSYAETNRGQAPSYATVTEQIPDFFYVPQVSDSYEWLTKRLLNDAGQSEFVQLVQSELPTMFSEMQNDIPALIDKLTDKFDNIKYRTDVREKVGTDLRLDGQKYLDEYQRRKDGLSFKLWQSKFPTINKIVGGYYSGNMYTWYARSGRGKSIVTMEEVVESAMQGATVLVWAMEMSKFEWLTRAYSAISGRKGWASATIKGVDYNVGFENRALLTGSLAPEFETGFRAFIDMLADDSIMTGRIIVRAADDYDFNKRGISELEADILATKADVVLIDPIYLLDFEANTSRTAGGDVAETSKKLRRMAGYLDVVMHVITQSEEVKDDTDEDGQRELRPPKRSEIKKSKAVLEDATNTFGIDSVDGQGLIEIGKGRNGGEGTQIQLLYLPNYGLVQEIETGADAVKQFNF